jgi:hypothetical protein
MIASDPSEFLFLFEKDMTIELQRLRRDLYFIHAAVLTFAGKAFMLMGESGSGKSTTTLALSNHGCRYLGDKLGSVDLQTMTVYPCPHALCLKAKPPLSYPLPAMTLHTSRRLHMRVEGLPSGIGQGSALLIAIFFVHYQPEALYLY